MAVRCGLARDSPGTICWARKTFLHADIPVLICRWRVIWRFVVKLESRARSLYAMEKSDLVDESCFLHLFFLNCEKYGERNSSVKMLFDVRKLVCS
jgi:hypothetical protein